MLDWKTVSLTLMDGVGVNVATVGSSFTTVGSTAGSARMGSDLTISCTIVRGLPRLRFGGRPRPRAAHELSQLRGGRWLDGTLTNGIWFKGELSRGFSGNGGCAGGGVEDVLVSTDCRVFLLDFFRCCWCFA
jgi:hypothetical protein